MKNVKEPFKNRIKPEKLEEAKFMVKEYLDYRKDVNDILETRNLKLPPLPEHAKWLIKYLGMEKGSRRNTWRTLVTVWFLF